MENPRFDRPHRLRIVPPGEAESVRRRAAVDYDAQAARRRRRTFAVLKIALPIALPVLLFAGLVKLAASRPPRSDFRW